MSGVIVVDEESFRSTYHGRDAYIHDHCLDNLITMLNSVKCSTVICSPTVEYLCSWEKPLVKPMAPGSILIISISITLFTCFCFYFLLCIFIPKIPKMLSLSNLTLVSDREGIGNPKALVASSYCFVQVRGTCAWSPTGLIPWFSKTEGNTYATVLHHPLLFGEIQRKLETSHPPRPQVGRHVALLHQLSRT